jgi:hypothetical protein
MAAAAAAAGLHLVHTLGEMQARCQPAGRQASAQAQAGRPAAAAAPPSTQATTVRGGGGGGGGV